MRRALFLAAACAVAAVEARLGAGCGSASGGPTDAPTATLYGTGSYPWAESMVPWDCVFNVADFGVSPSSADAAFAAAQKAAVAAGGGVVYFPAGTYTFKGNLEIASNVVVRGVPTTARAKVGKNPGPLKPTTIFKCPDRQHYGIFNIDANATNMGIVNVGLVGCAVMLWPALSPSVPVQWPSFLKDYWYPATGVVGSGSNKLVLGCTSVQVNHLLSDPTKPTSNPYGWRFSTAFSVYAQANSLVANNQVQQSPVGPDVTIKLVGDKNPSETVPFPYDNRYGIDSNRLLYGGVIGHTCTAGAGSAAPSCAPYFFPANTTVRDNWVYNCGRVSYVVASGCNKPGAKTPTLGDGLQLLDNHSEHCDGSICWTVDGVRLAGGSDTNENRGYDVGGYCQNVTGNSAHVYRMKTEGGFETVDGEGILFQAAANSGAQYNLWTGNDMTHSSNSSSGLASGYIAYYKLDFVDNVRIDGNIVDSAQYIGIVTDPNHNKETNVECSNNTPPATIAGKPC